MIDYFVAKINSDAADQPEGQSKLLSKNARELLQAHPWPGNVRELYHTLVRAMIWSSGPEVQAADIHSALLPISKVRPSPFERPLVQDFNLEVALDDVKRHYIQLALSKAGGRKSLAAKLLGFSSHQTLGNWMKRLGMEGDE